MSDCRKGWIGASIDADGQREHNHKLSRLVAEWGGVANDREEGLYWVDTGWVEKDAGWSVARYEDGRWTEVLGWDDDPRGCDDSAFRSIGPRITPPDSTP